MTDLISFLLTSPLSQFSFGLMAVLLLETIGVIVWSQIQMRRFKPLLMDLRRVRKGTASFAGSSDALAVGIDHFLGTEIARTRELLDTLEELAPKIGLILTALAFTIALRSAVPSAPWAASRGSRFWPLCACAFRDHPITGSDNIRSVIPI